MSPRPSRRRPSPRRRPVSVQPREGIGEILELTVRNPLTVERASPVTRVGALSSCVTLRLVR